MQGHPVATEHSAANEQIDGLRKAATTLKELGDENLRLKEENDGLLSDNAELEGENRSLEEELSKQESAQHQLDEWRDLLEDYKRGVRDRAELIERTVGK